MNFQILTFATDLNHPIFEVLKSKLPLTVLSCDNFDWEGTSSTIEVYNYLKNVPDTDLIMLTDSYDVLPLNECTFDSLRESIISNFNLNKVTFNAEINCYPDIEKKELYPESPGKWRYLNGGLSAGYAKSYKKMFEKVLQQDIIINQKNYTDIFLTTNLIDLDYRCTVFQNLLIPEKWPHHDVDMSDFIVEGKKITNKYFSTVPLLFHGAGKVNLKNLFPFIKTISS